MKYFIPQMDNTDCGFACLKMMIATLYENDRALYIKQNESHGAYSLKELQEKGGEYGIDLQGVEMLDKNEIKQVRLPFIALLKKKNDLYHYVLITKVKYGLVYYSDPDEGESVSTMKSFSLLWTGNGLLINDFNAINEPDFADFVVNKNEPNIPVIIFQILSALLLAIGIYFIDEKTKIYIPLMFFGASLICEIILRVLLVKQMETLDDTYLAGINVEKKRYFDFYQRYEDFKKRTITSKMNIIFTFIVIIFISFITLLNNIYNAFVILIPLLLSIIDTKFVDNSIKEKDELISLEEREINDIKNIDVLKNQIDKIHLRGYKVAKIALVKKYIYLAVLMVVSLLTTVFNETFSLPYVIFYFAIGYMLFEQFENFMRYPENQKEMLRSKVRLYNIVTKI